MKKTILFTLSAMLAASGISAQTNLLEKGFEGRSADDAMTRKYITPARIVAVPAEFTSGTAGAEALLQEFDGQLTTGTTDYCTLSTADGKKASVILDYGKELYGGIEIAAPIRANSKPVRVRVRFGESVSETFGEALGRTDFIDPMATATNNHSLRDFTLEIPWLGTVEIGNSGFRFVRIDLLDENETLPIRSVRAVLRYRDIPYLGSFRCSDPRLTQVWETGAYTVHLNMQDYLWDGIKRDRLVWLGDMHPELMTMVSVFGHNPVMNKSLDLGRDTTPAGEWMNGIAAYSMWWVLIHRDYYMYGGDLEYLREQTEYMRQLFAQFASRLDGPRENTGEGFRLLDWPTSEMPDVIHAGYQALLRMTFEAGVSIGSWTCDDEITGICLDALAAMEGYVPPHNDNKQAASLLSLAGMIDPGKAARTVVARGGPEGFSTFYGYYMLEALAKGGMYTEAMNIISQYWGAMIDLGATTFWENLQWEHVPGAARIDEVVPEGRFDIHACSGGYCYTGLRHSLCHGWASGPTAWLSRHVLGVEPLDPGCTKVRISPNLGNLGWAEGTFPTPYGVITVRHEKRKSGKTFSDVKAPPQIEIILK